jgi:hypothetical protein
MERQKSLYWRVGIFDDLESPTDVSPPHGRCGTKLRRSALSLRSVHFLSSALRLIKRSDIMAPITTTYLITGANRGKNSLMLDPVHC